MAGVPERHLQSVTRREEHERVLGLWRRRVQPRAYLAKRQRLHPMSVHVQDGLEGVDAK